MNAEQYVETIEGTLTAARTWALMLAGTTDADLRTALDTVARAEAFGCFTDPTAWIRATHSGSLERQRAILTATIAFRRELARIFPGDAEILRGVELAAPSTPGGS